MNLKIKSDKKNCIISAVGKDSLHREWIKGNSDFDLHLIVYDDSFDQYQKDTLFICSQKGYKLRLIYNYLQNNPEYLERYEYFFLPDDDIQMSTEHISKLFQLMGKYQLEIAQPGLSDSYYSYELFLRDKFCILRYTNFIEMMVPCFSRQALKKVLTTFNANQSGWGVDYHWPILINFTGKEMAIIDDLYTIHTRRIQSHNPANLKERYEYIKKHDLILNFIETDFIPIDSSQARSGNLITDRNTYKQLERLCDFLAKYFSKSAYTYPIGIKGLTGISLFLIHYSKLSEKKKYQDIALSITERIGENLGYIKEDISFSNGLSGFSWYIEYLAKLGSLENDTDEILEEICNDLNHLSTKKIFDFEIDQLLEIIPHYIARISNPTHTDTELHWKEERILTDILQKINSLSNTLSVQKEINLSYYILWLSQASKTLTLPEINSILSQLTEILKHSSDESSTYWLKTYLLLLASESMNNQSLKDQTVQDAVKYEYHHKYSNYQHLINTYLLYKIYRHTQKEIFKTRALEALHILMEKCSNEETFFINLTDQSPEEEKKRLEKDLLIRTGLILISLLSDKDTELDPCIL